MVWSPHEITFRPGEETDITTVGDRLNATRQERVISTIRKGIAANAQALQEIGFLDVPVLEESTQAALDRKEAMQKTMANRESRMKASRKPDQKRRMRRSLQRDRRKVSSMHSQARKEYRTKTAEDVAANAEAVLNEYEEAVAEGIEWKIEHTRRQLSKWSIAAEAFEPNLLLDWTIDRQEEDLEAGLGVKSLAHIEVALAEKYRDPENPAPCHHLHLGAGDYSIVNALQSGHELYDDAQEVYSGTGNEKNRCELWNEVGVSDKLYLSIEKILWKFVRPEMKRHPAVREIVSKLALGCQTGLTQKWYDSTGPQGQLEKNKKLIFRDLNDIFGLLATPEYLLQFVHFYNEGDPFLTSCTPASPEFAHEHLSEQKDNRPMSMDAHAWLIAYQEKFDGRTLNQYRQARGRAPVKCAESLGWLGREAQACFQNAVYLPAFQDTAQEDNESRAGQAQKQLWEICRKLEESLGIQLDALPTSRLEVPFVIHLVHQRLKRMYTLITGEAYKTSQVEEAALATVHSYDPNLQDEVDPLDADFWDAIQVLFVEYNRVIDEYTTQQLPNIPDSPLPADPLQSNHNELLEQIFSPEFTRGVRGFRLYRNADYRKRAAFSGNRFEHIEPEGGTGVSLTMENVPERAVVVLRSDRDPETEKAYLAGGESKQFCGHTVTRSQDTVSVEHYMLPKDFSVEVVSLPDLNEHAVFHGGHIPGQFNELGDLVPDQSFLLATASRSQSHEGEQGFVGTVETAITKLEPGGCMVTDGCIESYTRIMRFIESQEENFRVEVLFDRETHRPKSMFIQRAHPKGYLTDEEMRGVLSPGVYVQPVEDVFLRRDLSLMDRVRRRLLKEYKNKYAFADIHPTVEKVICEELVFAVYGAIMQRGSFYSGQRARAEEIFERAITGIRDQMQQTAALVALDPDITVTGNIAPTRLFKASVEAAPVTNLLNHLYPNECVSPPQLPDGELDCTDQTTAAAERDNDQLSRLALYWARNLDYNLPIHGSSDATAEEFNFTERELEQAAEALYERVKVELSKNAELRSSTANYMALYTERMHRLNPGMSRGDVMTQFFTNKIMTAFKTMQRIFLEDGEQQEDG